MSRLDLTQQVFSHVFDAYYGPIALAELDIAQWFDTLHMPTDTAEAMVILLEAIK